MSELTNLSSGWNEPLLAVDLKDLGAKKLQERGEVAAEEWARIWWRQPPASGKGQFSYQRHWRGLDEALTKKDERAFLQTDHSVHGDIRATNAAGELWGFSVFLGETSANRAGDRLAELPSGDNLQGDWKLPEPPEWLTIARRKPFVAAPGEVGSTSEKWSKFFEADHGEYEVGVWREHLMEVFFRGKKVKGRYLFEFAPIGGKRIWIIARPEDQTPYADSHELEGILAELKRKGQKYLVWAKPGEKPVTYDTSTGQPVGEKAMDDLGIELKAGRRLRSDKVNLLREIKTKFDDLIKNLAEFIGWTEYKDVQPKSFADWLHQSFKTFQGVDGRPWLLTWTTNAFVDRDREIFTTKAIEAYVTRHEDKEVKGEFWFWHLPGSKFGDIRWQGMSGRFLVETGPFDDTPVGRAFKAFLEANSNGHPQVAPEGWGTSHGYMYNAADRKDRVYDWFEKTETSVLPASVAANPWNPEMEVIEVDKKQINALKVIGGDELVQAVLSAGEGRTKELEGAGIAFKAAGEKKGFAEQIRAVAEGIEDEAVKKACLALADDVEGAYGYPPPKGKAKPEEEPKRKEGEKAKSLKDIGEKLKALAAKISGDDAKKLGAIADAMIKAEEKAKPEDEEYGYPPKGKKEGEGEPQLEFVTRQEVADAMLVLAQGLKAITDTLVQLKKTDEEKIAETVATTPKASLKAMVQETVIGKAETKVDGRRALGKKGPEEAPAAESQTGIPMIDSLMALNKARR
jgi:hypothetical protein